MMRPRLWHEALHSCQQQGQNYVLVTLLATAGSTPRDGGTKMVVCDDASYDTIGGGNLEFMVIKRARELLISTCQSQDQAKRNRQLVENFTLSSKLAQCCGGATNVLFEVFVSHSQVLAVYGAGHVAQALMPILWQLPLQIHWIDERPELFEQFKQAQAAIPANLRMITSDASAQSINDLPLSSWVLIMTHNHQLDFDLVCGALKRADCAYVGMIGSATKARRFTTRLAQRGVAPEVIKRLISPVGLLDIPGKEPIHVAVSIAAQLIQRLQAASQQKPDQRQQWLANKQLHSLLENNE